MKCKSPVLAATLGVLLATVLGGMAFAQGLGLTPRASEIESSASAALAGLYSQNEAARHWDRRQKRYSCFRIYERALS
jgi:hypothetical protein